MKTPKIGGTREKILVSALEVIAEHGVDAVTHRRVAQQADVSNGVVSYHFKTREMLLEEAFKCHLRDPNSLADALASDDIHNMAALIARLEHYSTLAMSNLAAVAIEGELLLYARRHTDLLAQFNEWDFRAHAQLTWVLENLGMDRPSLRARVIIGTIRCFLTECLINSSLTSMTLGARLTLVLSARPEGGNSIY